MAKRNNKLSELFAHTMPTFSPQSKDDIKSIYENNIYDTLRGIKIKCIELSVAYKLTHSYDMRVYLPHVEKVVYDGVSDIIYIYCASKFDYANFLAEKMKSNLLVFYGSAINDVVVDSISDEMNVIEILFNDEEVILKNKEIGINKIQA